MTERAAGVSAVEKHRSTRESMGKQSYCPFCMSPLYGGKPCQACGQSAVHYATPPNHLPYGSLLSNRYLVGRALGAGESSITYIGRDLDRGEKVVVKELFPIDKVSRRASEPAEVVRYAGVADEDLVDARIAFIRTARVLASLGGDGVMAVVLDFFEENGTAYLVAEHVAGTSLAQATVLNDGRIGHAELFGLVRPLFRALSALHDTGLFHGDISPTNILLTGGGVRLVDCDCSGTASTKARISITTTESAHVPIERYAGRRQGPWTDVYSLCASLYACLTGIEPPPALARVARDEIVSPRCLGVRMPAWQERALLRGLDVMPSRRFRTIPQLEVALYGNASKCDEKESHAHNHSTA